MRNGYVGLNWIGCLDLQSKNSEEMETLNQKIISLATYRSGLIKEIKVLHQKRKDIRQEIRGLSRKIEETRETLGDGYNTYKNTRKIRRETISKIRELQLKIQPIEMDLKKFEQNIPKEKSFKIAEMLKAADWKIQTEKLTREEEKQLVHLVKDLESKLRLLKKAYEIRQNIYDKRGEINILKDKMDEIVLSGREAETEFETAKDRFTHDFKVRDQLYKEIDEMNEDISELENAIEKTDQQLDEMRKKRRDMISIGKEQEIELVKNKEQELLAKAKSEAKDKLLQGRKLTFEELKLAFEEEHE